MRDAAATREAVSAGSNAFADYIALTKPRLNFLVVASSAAGYYLGGPSSPDFGAMAQVLCPSRRIM